MAFSEPVCTLHCFALFLFISKTGYFKEGAIRTEPSSSVSGPWYRFVTVAFSKESFSLKKYNEPPKKLYVTAKEAAPPLVTLYNMTK